jgi:predicted exporter
VPRRLPLLALLAFALVCATWLLSLDPRAHFTTDVTELLPADERDPEASLALSLVRERQARVILVALDAPEGTPPAALAAAVEAYAASLRASPAFVAAHSLADQTWQQPLGRLLHARRLELLLPAWLAEQRRAHAAAYDPSPFPQFLAARASAALEAHLASPEGAATAELLASDPLLLLPALADRASAFATAPTPSRGRALVWAETRAGPLSEEGQQPAFAALAAATQHARVHVPALTTRDTGVHRFAAAAKSSTRAEISRLNFLALAAVLAVTALFVRRVPGLLHLVPLVLLATLGAAAVTTAIFPRVHVLVFGLGALLSGVAVDYAFHLILARRENESYRARLRRFFLPLLGGAGTTVAGFLALTFSELPLVRQLGVYVAAGILCGLGVTLAYLALIPRLDLRPRLWAPSLALPPRLRAPLLVALAAVSVLGLTRIRWHDDLRSLEYPSPDLRAEDAALRAAFGETVTSATYLTRGATFAEARAAWQAFADNAPADASVAGIATLLPLPVDHAVTRTPETRTELAQFARAFAAATEAAGFEPDAFTPFLADLDAFLTAPAPDYETLARDTLAALPGPLGMLAHHDADTTWFLSNAPRAFPLPPAVAAHTRSLAGLESLNQLFARYRAATARLSLLGLAALVLISCALHGLRAGLRTAALPLLAAGLAFGLLALRGEAFGLFHVLGALLGVCLADDYAHFAHADDGTPHARASIRLSALTTAASFAVLTFSAIPAVSALGATVALIVTLALLWVETDLLSLRGHVS